MKRLGPVLQFLGCDAGQWRVSTLWVQVSVDAPPVLTAGGRPVQLSQAPVPGSACTAWRFEFAVLQTAAEQDVAYSIGGENHGFCVPARDTMPSLAYASCNGFSDPTLMKKVQQPNALWARLGRLHAGADRVDSQTYGPLHLLLLGGDQVYSELTRARNLASPSRRPFLWAGGLDSICGRFPTRSSTKSSPSTKHRSPNIYDNGRICWGSHKVPKVSVNNIERVWQIFFGTAFNEHIASKKCRSFPSNVLDLLRKLSQEEATSFPFKELGKADQGSVELCIEHLLRYGAD